MSSRYASIVLCSIAVSLIVSTAQPASAAARDDKWTFEISPYFWLAKLDGDLTVRSADFDVDQSLGDAWDMLTDHFDLAGAVHFEAHKGRWGLIGDVMYLGLESEVTGPFGIIEADAEFKQFVGEAGASYRVIDAESDGGGGRRIVEVLGGVRYNSLSVDLKFPNGASPGDDQNWIDPFIGLRGSIAATDRISFFARGDIGGFGIDEGNTSDLVWNVSGGVSYDLSRHASLLVGYRWMGTDFEDEDDGFKYDVVASGPFLALNFRW